MHPISFRLFFSFVTALFGIAPVAIPQTQVPYSHGDPTPLEQLMLEQVNRARQDPPGEAALHGISFYDGNAWNDDIDLTPKQPLAFNPLLIAAARTHTQWMFDAKKISHTGAGNSDASARILSAGYVGGDFFGWGENIAWSDVIANQVSDEQAARDSHRTLFISEGSSHRYWMLVPVFQEVGVGTFEGQMTLNGSNRRLLLSTENYASSEISPTPVSAGAFLLGVVYNDLNNNAQYDVGEGLGDVEVRPSVGDYYAVTSASGGYAIPMGIRSGAVTLTFNGNGVVNHQETASMTFYTNLKVDLRLQDAQPSLAELDAWLQLFLNEGLTEADLAYDLDPDGDNWNNLLEFAFGGHPARKDLPSRSIEATPANGNTPPKITYWLSENSQTLRLTLRCSTNLEIWNSVAVSEPNSPFTPTETEAFTLTETIIDGQRRLDVILTDISEPCYYQIEVEP